MLSIAPGPDLTVSNFAESQNTTLPSEVIRDNAVGIPARVPAPAASDITDAVGSGSKKTGRT
jgi:hypothetical protein